MKIYGFPTFNVLKVLFTAEELGLEYEFVMLDAQQGQHKTPEHIRRHPLGKVPAIEHDGNYLFESAAICRYLAVIAESSLYAGTPLQRASVDQWVDMMGYHAGRWLSVYFWEEVAKPRFMGKPSDQDALKEAAGFLDKQLPAINRQLGENRFLAGDQLSIADTFACSYFTVTENTSASIGNYSNLSRWYEELTERPAFARAKAQFSS
jgi:glutathione S-transferase